MNFIFSGFVGMSLLTDIAETVSLTLLIILIIMLYYTDAFVKIGHFFGKRTWRKTGRLFGWVDNKEDKT